MRYAVQLVAFCALLLTACGSSPDFGASNPSDAGTEAHGDDTGSPPADAATDTSSSDTGAPPTDSSGADIFTPDPAQRFRCTAGAPRLTWSETSGCTDTGAVVDGATMRPFLCTFVKTTVAGDLYCLPSLSGSVIGYNDAACSGATETPPTGYLDNTSWAWDSTTEATPQLASGFDGASGLWFAWSVTAEAAPATWWKKQSDGTCQSEDSHFTPPPTNINGDTLRSTGPVDFTTFVRAS